MRNLHIIKVKFLGATDTRGSRTKLISERFKHAVMLSYDYKCSSSLDQAVEYLQDQGHNVIGKSGGKDFDYVICDHIDNSFKGLK